MTTVGIVGAGVAGLHLALLLQKHGVDATVYTDRSPGAMRIGPLPSTVALMGSTLARDAALGVDHWNAAEQGTGRIGIRIAGDQPLVVHGKPARPMLFIDMRVYVPRLMDDFAARGGRVVVSSCDPGEVARLAADHDLMVVTSGRSGLCDMFPRASERSPYREPQRRLFAGLFRGIRLPRPFTMGFNIVPGHGEIFENQFLTREGYVSGLLFEAVPGGALDHLTRLRHEDDPRAFHAAVIAALREFAPGTYARIDPAAFALTGPLDTLSGAIVPTARRGWAQLPGLPGGRMAMALGDAHVTHDPITGQGANAAARAAWILGEALAARAKLGGRFDEAFCAQAEQRVWEGIRAATEWTNAFLQPPPPHVIGLLVRAARNPAVADAFLTNFDHPDRMWASISSPEATAAFLDDFGPVSRAA